MILKMTTLYRWTYEGREALSAVTNQVCRRLCLVVSLFILSCSDLPGLIRKLPDASTFNKRMMKGKQPYAVIRAVRAYPSGSVEKPVVEAFASTSGSAMRA